MKKIKLATAIGLPLLVVIILLVLALTPGPDIVVSPQTTFIMEPLSSNGLPDYERYLLESGLSRVSLDDNAAALLWRACWPAELSVAEAKLILKAIGAGQLANAESTLTSLYHADTRIGIVEWLSEQSSDLRSNLGDPKYDVVEQLVRLAMTRPWTRQQIPPLANWVDKNSDALDLIVLASQRPKLFSPSPTWLNDEYDMLIRSRLPLTMSIRTATNGLCVRAMLRLGEGRAEEAYYDSRACLRLAALTRQGYCFVQQMIAIETYDTAFRALVAILHAGDFSPEALQSLKEELDSSMPFYDSARILDQGERLNYLDSLIAVKSGKDHNSKHGVGGWWASRADWNVALIEGNRIYDKMVAIASKPTREQRLTGVAELYSELDELSSRAEKHKGDKLLLFDRQRCGEAVSAIFLDMLPSVHTVFNAEDRQATCRQMALIAVDLAIYRAAHDRYPETLDQLSTETPIDLFSDKPFIYKPTKNGGYLLYSVFENGADDGGNDIGGEIFGGEWAKRSLDAPRTDFVICLPTPTLELK